MHDRSVFSARISVCISSVAREAAAFAPPVVLSPAVLAPMLVEEDDAHRQLLADGDARPVRYVGWLDAPGMPSHFVHLARHPTLAPDVDVAALLP